jgi:hypothetical protein
MVVREMKVIGMKRILFILILGLAIISLKKPTHRIATIANGEKEFTGKYPAQINGQVKDFCINNDLLFVSINEGDIEVYNKSNPNALELITVIPCENTTKLATKGDLLITGGLKTSLIKTINISNPLEPDVLGIHESEYTYDPLYQIVVQGNYLFAVDVHTIDIYNIADPTNITKIATYNSVMSSPLPYMYISGNLAFKYGTEEGVEIIDIDDIDNPQFLAIVDEVEFKYRTEDVMVKDGYLITMPYTDALKVYDMENPSDPKLVERGDETGNFFCMTRDGDITYLADANDIKIINMTNMREIKTFGVILDTSQVTQMVIDDEYLYCVFMPAGYGGLGVIPVDDAIDYTVTYTPPTSTPPTSRTPGTISLVAPGIIIGVVIPLLFIGIIRALILKRK